MKIKKPLTFECGSLLTTPHPLYPDSREIFPMVCVEIRKIFSKMQIFTYFLKKARVLDFLVIFLVLSSFSFLKQKVLLPWRKNPNPPSVDPLFYPLLLPLTTVYL